MAKPRPIAAELGRSETDEERAARKATEARQRRERTTLTNFLIALGASLLMVALIVQMVPRSEEPIDFGVDPAAAAELVEPNFGAPVLVPEVNAKANAAEVRTSSDQVQSWYIGWSNVGDEFLSFQEAVSANPGWVAKTFGDQLPDGAERIAGLNWQVYDNRDVADLVGNAHYGLVTDVFTADGTPVTLVLVGTATPEDVHDAAVKVAAEVNEAVSAGTLKLENGE